ncbi:MAG: ABC transporter ATP-binding protein [Pseudomonadota bacterium]
MNNAANEVQIRAQEPVLVAQNLTLKVPVVTQSERSVLANPLNLFVDLYTNSGSRTHATLLEDISFKLYPGQRLGLIGRNGAGKSTLLRLLAGIYQPSHGHLDVRGVAKGLFDISLGMQPEATGIENVYIRGLQMGLSSREIRERIPEIMDFSELGDAMSKPLMTYSTGMRLRLAISVSTMIEPDILLLDEWIGAGDAHFNAKVRNRMMSLVKDSRGLVLATHNPVLMRSICSHGVVMSGGRIQFHGEIEDALAFYREQNPNPELNPSPNPNAGPAPKTPAMNPSANPATKS